MKGAILSFLRSIAGKGGSSGPGGRIPILVLLAALSWAAAFSLWADGRDLRSRRELQKKRFADFAAAVEEYRGLAGMKNQDEQLYGEELEEGLLTGVSNVAASLGMRTNLRSIAAQPGRSGAEAVSAALEGLSTEQLARFIQETERRGIMCEGAEIRAVRNAPAEDRPARSLSVTLILGRRDR